MLFESIHHIAIIGRNYNKTKEFYVKKLGFKIIKQNGPTYFYTQGSQREPRYNYMRKNIEKLYNKKVLKYWNPQETEEINMYKNGFGRIWNCGTYKVRYQQNV